MLQLEPIATAPTLEVTPQDIATLGDELHAYHAIYAPLFQRREQREWSAKYLHGLLVLCTNCVRGDAVVDGERVRPSRPELLATRWLSGARDAVVRRAGDRLHGPSRQREWPAPRPRQLPGAGRRVRERTAQAATR